MKLSHTLGGQYLIHGKEFPIHTIILYLDNGIEMYCQKSAFKKRNKKLPILIYSPDKKTWFRCKIKNEYTDLMWEYYYKHKHKFNPQKKKYYKHRSSKKGAGASGTKPVTIPPSVKWAAEHPFQGGGVSPR